jgi:hypothetical protein
MGRYRSDIIVCDNTPKASWNCVRTLNPGQGACVFQLTGGTGGCASTGNFGSGNCCLWTVPAGITSIVIELWGGGGGGGSAVACMCCHYGGGAGGGAYSRKTITGLTAGTQYTLCAGGPGAGGGKSGMSGPGCCCGAQGSTSYVTGAGLTNFCAGGGYGGESRCSSFLGIQTGNGGLPGAGGDLNVRGYDGGWHYHNQSCWSTGWGWGGGSPFGGRNMYIAGDDCSIYSDKCGNQKWGGACGLTGNFPGGGGTGGNSSCCCGICVCGGDGAAGLIRIWM